MESYPDSGDKLEFLSGLFNHLSDEIGETMIGEIEKVYEEDKGAPWAKVKFIIEREMALDNDNLKQ